VITQTINTRNPHS